MACSKHTRCLASCRAQETDERPLSAIPAISAPKCTLLVHATCMPRALHQPPPATSSPPQSLMHPPPNVLQGTTALSTSCRSVAPHTQLTTAHATSTCWPTRHAIESTPHSYTTALFSQPPLAKYAAEVAMWDRRTRCVMPTLVPGAESANLLSLASHIMQYSFCTLHPANTKAALKEKTAGVRGSLS
jgi:hypothetical protein